MRELIENESTLTNYSKRRMLRYFDEFFKEVSSAEDVESIFCGDCLAGRSTR
jgi:hypothetical protein